MNTIHVWKCVGMLTIFYIKWKFQDTSVHHTSLTLVVGCWSHCFLLKEKITYPQGYVGGAKVKIPLHVQMRGIYSQGWTWPLWLFDFPHDCLTYMTLQLKWLFKFICGSLGLPHYITLITTHMSHSSDVAEMNHDMTWHYTTSVYMLMVVSMSSCCVTVLLSNEFALGVL